MTYRYVAGRLFQSLMLIGLVVSTAFVLIHVAPGDPVTFLYGGQSVSADVLAQVRHAWGLDRPLWEQYAAYMANIVRGNLGYSQINFQSVASILGAALPNTLLLMMPSVLLAAVFGIALGMAAARRSGTGADYAIGAVSLISYATPPFWLSVLFIIVFASRLHWFPTQGMATLGGAGGGFARAADIAWHMVLPLSVLAWWYSASFARLTRASIVEESRKYYLMTARMKGLSEFKVFYRHALRNAMRPVITVLGVQLGTMFAGAVMTEIVFAWPGTGRVIYTAILQHDYPVVLGFFLVVGSAVILANLAVDLAYVLIDPRIRYA
ncbi:MAG TPA: ABC transporter permease [bacterium]|nr:ABC transporter permease [bacterium]